MHEMPEMRAAPWPGARTAPRWPPAAMTARYGQRTSSPLGVRIRSWPRRSQHAAPALRRPAAPCAPPGAAVEAAAAARGGRAGGPPGTVTRGAPRPGMRLRMGRANHWRPAVAGDETEARQLRSGCLGRKQQGRGARSSRALAPRRRQTGPEPVRIRFEAGPVRAQTLVSPAAAFQGAALCVRSGSGVLWLEDDLERMCAVHQASSDAGCGSVCAQRPGRAACV